MKYGLHVTDFHGSLLLKGLYLCVFFLMYDRDTIPLPSLSMSVSALILTKLPFSRMAFTCWSVVQNFTEIDQEIWKVRIEMYLYLPGKV